MGDCRLRILVAKDLLKEGALPNSSSPWFVESRIFSADTTVREVVDEVCYLFHRLSCNDDNGTTATLRHLLLAEACLWDCTVHPPKNITDWPTHLFPDKVGPKSKTLYDAGWFPSGTLQILPAGQGQPTTALNHVLYEDEQYNVAKKFSSEATPAVRLLPNANSKDYGGDTAMRMPSQIMECVTSRFQGEKKSSSTPLDILETRRRIQTERKRKESERNRKLEERIKKLAESSTSQKKSSKTSQQVQRMLIKSRCIGRKGRDIDMKDRVYLYFVVVSGEDSTTEDYQYFSRQDTVGRLVTTLLKPSSSFSSLPQHYASELLVRYSNKYRRLPTCMRLYEAIARQYLNEVDSILLRCYSADTEEPTSSILENDIEDDNNMQIETIETVVDVTECSSATNSVGNAATTAEEVVSSNNNNNDELVHARIHKMLKDLDAKGAEKADGKKSRKKVSATSTKVRTMLIKGRATGDKKRIPNIVDRFFLEMRVFRDYHDGEGTKTFSTGLETTKTAIFMAGTDQVGRLLRDYVAGANGFGSMVLAPSSEGSGFTNLPQDLSWHEAEGLGMVQAFDQIIIRLHK